MQINYRSHGFPASFGSTLAGTNSLSFTIQELLWAAITVGRANHLHVLGHGIFSEYEILYRASIIIANLAISGNDVVKSSAYESLDPSEKSAVSYFLGLTFTKLLSERLLNIPWLVHADVYRDQFMRAGIPLRSGTSKQRPDLIGLNVNWNWIVMESKGRSNAMHNGVLTTAKSQTQNLRSIGLTPPYLRVAVVTHFVNGLLVVDWQDPAESEDAKINLETDTPEYLSNYYRLIYRILSQKNDLDSGPFVTRTFEQGDLTIGLERRIFDFYHNNSFGEIRSNQNIPTSKRVASVDEIEYIGTDGILIRPGKLWQDFIRSNKKG